VLDAIGKQGGHMDCPINFTDQFSSLLYFGFRTSLLDANI
jgi:hypothetical protein